MTNYTVPGVGQLLAACDIELNDIRSIGLTNGGLLLDNHKWCLSSTLWV